MSAHLPRQFDYEAFIEELKPLIDQAKSFENSDCAHDSEIFRAWKLKVASLTTKISRSYLKSGSSLDSRQFRVMRIGGASPRAQLEAFNRDLADTLLELDLIVEHHTKFGNPEFLHSSARKAVESALAAPAIPAEVRLEGPNEREWPTGDKLTLHWLFKHMPASAWGWLALFVCGAFSIGMAVGAWPVLQSQFSASSPTPKPPPTATHSVSK